jgi:hypothetical protein
MFNKKFLPAPLVRALLNIGCLFDIPTGHYVTGKYGESILIGGLAPLTGIGGRGNMYKSTIAHFMLLSALDRYIQANAQVFDTEMSLTMTRMHQLAAKLPNIGGKDLEELQRLMITDQTVYKGEAWFELLKEMVEEKILDTKSNIGTMPVMNRDGKPITTWYPTIVEVDSLSQFTTSSMEKIQGEADVGSSGRNILALRSSMAKNQLLEESPGLTGRTGTYMIFTAHIGDDLALDPYAPPAKKLTFLKNKVKFKRVPENFTFLMNNCWYCFHAEPMINQTTKAPEFPRDSDDDMKGDTDLMKVSLLQLRGKSGPTGLPIEVLVSQSEGVLRSLSEFHYIKSMGRYGIGGNDRNYFLELMPDVSLSRTTVRGKIDENLKLQRALEITSEMCQIESLWHEFDDALICTPKELYEGLKAQGYDWDMLLSETRGYWVFEEAKDAKKFLSTKDLLNIKAGRYVPYWLSSEEKVKLAA